MNGRVEARRMLSIAWRDPRAVDSVVDVPGVPDLAFGFWVQQAIEKGIKAWLALSEVDFPFIHDLRALLGLLRRAGVDTSAFHELVRFTDFGVRHRYEAVLVDPDELALVADRRAVAAEVAASFTRAKPPTVAAVLDSLATLGVLTATGEGDGRRWG